MNRAFGDGDVGFFIERYDGCGVFLEAGHGFLQGGNFALARCFAFHVQRNLHQFVGHPESFVDIPGKPVVKTGILAKVKRKQFARD